MTVLALKGCVQKGVFEESPAKIQPPVLACVHQSRHAPVPTGVDVGRLEN